MDNQAKDISLRPRLSSSSLVTAFRWKPESASDETNTSADLTIDSNPPMEALANTNPPAAIPQSQHLHVSVSAMNTLTDLRSIAATLTSLDAARITHYQDRQAELIRLASLDQDRKVELVRVQKTIRESDIENLGMKDEIARLALLIAAEHDRRKLGLEREAEEMSGQTKPKTREHEEKERDEWMGVRGGVGRVLRRVRGWFGG